MVGLHNIRVNQVRHQLGFADEVLDEHLLAGEARADHLDRHALDEIARPMLLPFVNNAHPALKNLADDLVTEPVLYGKQGHPRMLEN